VANLDPQALVLLGAIGDALRADTDAGAAVRIALPDVSDSVRAESVARLYDRGLIDGIFERNGAGELTVWYVQRITAAGEDTLAAAADFSRHDAPAGRQILVRDPVAARREGNPGISAGGRLFISHSHLDAAIGDALIELLQLGADVSRSDIVFTAGPGTGIPTGVDFFRYLRDRLRDTGLVIQLVTPSFLTSTFCLLELGGVWAMEAPSFPVIVPPVTYAELAAIMPSLQAERIDDPAGLDRLHDRLRSVLGVEPDTARWSRQRDGFVGKVRSLLPAHSAPRLADAEQLRIRASSAARRPAGTRHDSASGAPGLPLASVTSEQQLTYFTWSGTSPIRVFTAHADGSRHTAITPPGLAADPSWSADGRRFAFTAWSGPRGPGTGPNRRIGIFELGTGQWFDVTDGLADDHTPVWSPTRDDIVFLRTAPPNHDVHLMAVELRSGHQRQLTPTGAGSGRCRASGPMWHPDGTRLLFWGRGWEGVGDRTYVVQRDGSGFADMLGMDDAVCPSWSPDGRQVAFIASGRVWVISSEGEDPRVLDSPSPLPRPPVWAPDSGSVIIAVGAGSDTPGIYSAGLYSKARLLANTTHSSYDPGDDHPALDETGELIAFVGADGDVWITTIWGTDTSRVLVVDNGVPLGLQFISSPD
jgi:Tol biopolymer transport system component